MLQRLGEMPGLEIVRGARLAQYTRFALGGPCLALIDIASPAALSPVFALLRQSAAPQITIGGGSNLLVSDAGWPGWVLRFTASQLERRGDLTWGSSGATWQSVVDFHVAAGLSGMEKMTAIPGWLGGAIYGNAGAYGQTLMDFTHSVEVFDGQDFLTIPRAECGFVYRSSRFKSRKDWLVTGAHLYLPPGDPAALAAAAQEIFETRNQKFPPTMKCAGSIFKNQLADRLPPATLARVPAQLIRGGKIPSAWFLEQIGAKGLRQGGIEVAPYHANLIYNTGSGTAEEVCVLIDELKARVEEEFDFLLEEEVQFIGFPDRESH